jgi:hypothetical protein
MPRLPRTQLRLLSHPSRPFTSYSRLLTEAKEAKTSKTSPFSPSVNTGPGYEGRHSNDHAVNRTEQLDPQSQASHSGMAAHEKGEEGSQALSRRDEGQFQKKAKEQHPEAPGPVLGMNDERGGVSDPTESKIEVKDRAQEYRS